MKEERHKAFRKLLEYALQHIETVPTKGIIIAFAAEDGGFYDLSQTSDLSHIEELGLIEAVKYRFTKSIGSKSFERQL
jgi:hypothetical protein